MGDWALCGARISFCWNDGLLRRGSCVVIGLPCAVRGVYAHGSGIVVIAGVAVPHDSAVPTDAECTRVCNTQPPPRHTQALTKPPRSGEARPVRSSAPRHRTPHRSDGVRPISTRGTTDLGTECDRSRRGTGPISTRNRTDLDAEPDRSRRKGRRVRRAGRQAVRRSGPCGYRPRRRREAAPPRAPGTPRGRPTARPTPAGAALPHWPPPRAQADEARA